jgi:integrase
MIRRVQFYARFSDPDGSYPRVPVAFHKNGKPIEPVPPQGSSLVTYQIRIAGKYVGVGKDFAPAVNRWRLEQARVGVGVARSEAIEAPASVGTSETATDGRARIAEVTKEFVAELRTLDRKKYSVAMYENALRDFQKSCRKEFIDEIDRKDILGFISWMRDNLSVRVPGSENCTYKNKINYLGTFLARHGVQLKKKGNGQGASDPGLIYRSDIPKIVKKKPKKYDGSEIELLMKHADVDEKDYLMFLLWSGFRDEEVQYLQYNDFHFRSATVGVHAKPHYGWKPKDYEEREVTLPTDVLKQMKERMDRPQQYRDGYRKPKAEDLVFPNGSGNPDSHLIYRLHAVAGKAGLNLKGKRAGHMFRKTAGSRVAKKLGLPAAMEFLGHSNIETTALYLAADTSDIKRKREVVDQMFEAGD